MRRRARAAVAFNSGVAVESRAKGDPAVERVRERLMGAFELERRRITAANAVQGNLARRSLRNCANTEDLRRFLNYVDDKGTVSELAMLQMTCAYMDAPNWLDASMRVGPSAESTARLEAQQRRERREARARLSTQRAEKRQRLEEVARGIAAVLRTHIDGFPPRRAFDRWLEAMEAAAQRREELALAQQEADRRANQADADAARLQLAKEVWRDAHQMWQCRDLEMDPELGPSAPAAEAEAEAGPRGRSPSPPRPQRDVTSEPVPPPPSAAGFPSTELQLEMVAARHAAEGPERRARIRRLQQQACEELQRAQAAGATIAEGEIADALRAWAEQGKRRLDFVAPRPETVPAPRPPPLSRPLDLADGPSSPTSPPPEIVIYFVRPLRCATADGDKAEGAQDGTMAALGLELDDGLEQLLRVRPGSAAAAMAQKQPKLLPGLYLTHVQGEALRWHAAREAQLRTALRAALDSGEMIELGFTSRPPHVYRVMEAAFAQAQQDALNEHAEVLRAVAGTEETDAGRGLALKIDEVLWKERWQERHGDAIEEENAAPEVAAPVPAARSARSCSPAEHRQTQLAWRKEQGQLRARPASSRGRRPWSAQTARPPASAHRPASAGVAAPTRTAWAPARPASARPDCGAGSSRRGQQYQPPTRSIAVAVPSETAARPQAPRASSSGRCGC